MRAIVSSVVILIGSLAGPASADEIKTRVPQAHFDAFVQDCRTKDIPSATCQCMALKMIDMGQDGEIALDAMGLHSRKFADKESERKAAVALLDRYHVTASQAQAAIAKIGAGSDALGQSCA
jgi:hypothetical protein